MTTPVDHIEGVTYHGRKGAVQNRFRHTIDYLLLDAEAEVKGPALFSRNGRNVTTLDDRDHGGEPKNGEGATWVRKTLRAHQITGISKIELLAQPKVLGHVFNPVAFWLCRDEAGALRAVIAEVNNTFGDRHSYICAHDDQRAIAPDDTIQARKVFHVSPFQPIEGDYEFRFDIREDKIGIWINYLRAEGGLIATLTGPRKPLRSATVLRMLWRRPFGSRRVLALIHWQALKLWFKGATYRARPTPPTEETTRGWSGQVPGE